MSDKVKKEKVTPPIIKDPLLGDYFIVIGDDTFDLYYHTKEIKNAQCYGHFREFKNVIKEVIKYRFNERFSGESLTLKEYIEKYELLQKNLEKLLKV